MGISVSEAKVNIAARSLSAAVHTTKNSCTSIYLFATELSQQYFEPPTPLSCLYMYRIVYIYTDLTPDMQVSFVLPPKPTGKQDQVPGLKVYILHVLDWCWRCITCCHFYTQIFSLTYTRTPTYKHTQTHKITKHNSRSLKCWWAPAAASMMWRYFICLSLKACVVWCMQIIQGWVHILNGEY